MSSRSEFLGPPKKYTEFDTPQPDIVFIADVAARTAAECIRRGVPICAVEAAVRGACAAAVQSRVTLTSSRAAPPTTYGHARRRHQLRTEHQDRVQLHIEQAQARWTVQHDEELGVQSALHARKFGTARHGVEE